jgi:hypothetical protein
MDPRDSDDAEVTTTQEKHIEINVSVKLTHVHCIVASDQSFFADFVVLAEWKPGSRGAEWSPHLSVSNTVSLDTVFDTGNQVQGEYIRRITRFRGTLTADFPFMDFPFDIQELSITLRLGVPSSDAVLRQGVYSV